MKNMQLQTFIYLFLWLVFPFGPAWSYVGPGVGITMLGTFWAFFSLLGILVTGVLIWPVRSFWKHKKRNKNTIERKNEDSPESTDN